MDNQDQVLQQILETVGGIKTDVNGLKETVGGIKESVDVLKEDVGVLKKDMGLLKEDVGVLKKDMGLLKEDVGIIKEKVEILEENAVTHKELQEALTPIVNKLITVETKVDKCVTRDEFQEFKTTIYSHIDGFTKLHETLDQEFVFLRHKYDKLDERVTRIEQRMGVVAA